MRLHIVIRDGHPVFLLESVGKRVGRLQGLNHEYIVGRRKLDQQHRRDGRLRDREVCQLLRNAVFQDPEIFLLQTWHKLPVLGGDQHVHVYQRDVHLERVVRKIVGLSGGNRRRGRGRIFRLLFWNRIRPHVVARTSGFSRDILLGLAVVLGLRRIGRSLILWILSPQRRTTVYQHERKKP